MKKLKPKFDLLYNEDHATADLFDARTGEVLAQIEFEGEAGVRVILETGASTAFKVRPEERKKTAVVKAAADFIRKERLKKKEGQNNEQLP